MPNGEVQRATGTRTPQPLGRAEAVASWRVTLLSSVSETDGMETELEALVLHATGAHTIDQGHEHDVVGHGKTVCLIMRNPQSGASIFRTTTSTC